MPRVSKKSRLIEEVTENAVIMALTMEDKKIDAVIWDTLEELYLLQATRCSVPRMLVPKSDAWYVQVLPSHDDDRFKRYMRVSRHDFGRILELIRENYVFKSGPNRQIAVEKQLAIALYKFGCAGTGAGVGNVAALFGIGDGGTVMKIMKRVISALVDIKDDWIQWPNPEERREIEHEMDDSLPKCIGFIDGSHINLEESPKIDPESYFDRKQNYSIQLQAVCDMNRKIRHIFVGYPGSAHDSRVFTNSEIGKDPTKFVNCGQWIAGDSAYPLSANLITPFRRNANFSTEAKRKHFNKYFSSYRVKIECCFGILKETFSSLKELRVRINDVEGHKLACKWITACCILYNIIHKSLEFEEIEPIDEDDNEEESITNPTRKQNDIRRKELFEFVMRKFTV